MIRRKDKMIMADMTKYNKTPKIVLDFDELFKKILDNKEQFSDFKDFRNKLIKISEKKELK